MHSSKTLFGDFEDVIDDVQNRSFCEIDGDDMAVWLPKMELNERVNLGDGVEIERIR